MCLFVVVVVVVVVLGAEFLLLLFVCLFVVGFFLSPGLLFLTNIIGYLTKKFVTLRLSSVRFGRNCPTRFVPSLLSQDQMLYADFNINTYTFS